MVPQKLKFLLVIPTFFLNKIKRTASSAPAIQKNMDVFTRQLGGGVRKKIIMKEETIEATTAENHHNLVV